MPFRRHDATQSPNLMLRILFLYIFEYEDSIIHWGLFWFQSVIGSRMSVGFLNIVNEDIFTVIYFNCFYFTLFLCAYSLDYVRRKLVTAVGWTYQEPSNQVFVRICFNLHTQMTYWIRLPMCLLVFLFILFLRRFCFPLLPLFPLSLALSLSPFFIPLSFPRSRWSNQKLACSRYFARSSSRSPAPFSQMYLRCLDKCLHLLASGPFLQRAPPCVPTHVWCVCACRHSSVGIPLRYLCDTARY